MSDTGSSDGRLEAIIQRLRRFVAAREWLAFHDPKNLAMAIGSEAGELLALLRWVANDRADEFVRDPANRDRIEWEVADVAIALLLFCDRTGIDLLTAIDRKVYLNDRNYPVDQSRGRAERPVRAAPDSSPPRIVAVDWSGEAAGGRQTINRSNLP